MNRIAVFLATFSLMVFAACNKTINGSGHYITDIRTIGAFTAIESDGDFDVILTKDSLFTLSVYGEDNIVPEIKTVISGDQLVLGYNNSNNSIHDNGVTIYITAPLIEGLNLLGSGSFSSDSTFDPTAATLNIGGSGNIDFDVNCSSIITNISGSGSITLHGMTTDAQHTISGSGNIHAFNLPCNTANINISGSGTCEVNVSDLLQVTISGSGDVIYQGNPPIITTNISGSGHVKPF